MTLAWTLTMTLTCTLTLTLALTLTLTLTFTPTFTLALRASLRLRPKRDRGPNPSRRSRAWSCSGAALELLWSCSGAALELLAFRTQVLELGAGTGLCGLALAQCRNLHRCTLTDVVPATLDNLRHNVRQLPPAAVPCRVAALDWCAPESVVVRVVVAVSTKYLTRNIWPTG